MTMHLHHISTEGRLPTSTFTLINNDGAEAGLCQIRHKPSHRSELPPAFANHVGYEIYEPFRCKGYGTTLLTLAKEDARKIGLSEIRLTCDPDNIGSKKIIERNGGILIDVERQVGDLLYRIHL